MKRLIAWAMTMVLLLSLLPMGITAETAPEAHSHSAAQHDCECGAVGCTEEGHKKVIYEPWTSTTTLPSSGNYYLTGNVNLAGETSVTADLNLCLNGYTVTAATSGKQIITTPKNNTLTLVISDCTAHTDAAGNYTAGVLTGGVDKGKGRGGGAIQIRDKGNLKLYDGVITGNTSDTSGGAIRLGAGATFVMAGGEISGNTAISGTTLKSGGAISMLTGGNVQILGGTIKNNKGSDGGAIYTQSNITIKNCTISGNNAGRGGALFISGGATATLEDCVIKENKMNAEGAGAVYVTGSKATLTRCELTGNYGTNASTGGASAVYSAANSTVGIHDCTITGNTMAGTGTTFRGAVYTANATEKLTISGKTVIDGNLVAMDGTPKEMNVYLRSLPTTPVDIGGLTSGAKLSIRSHWGTETTPTFVKYTTAPATWYHSYVVYDNNGKAIDFNTTDGFHFVTNTIHSHCECGNSSCTAHKEVEYLPWNDKTSLPTSGNYYLNTDVTMEAETSISADLNLCLHSHTVTAAKDKRHLSTPNNANVTITISDCTAATTDGVYTAGKLTGGVDKGNGTGGGSIYIRTGGTLKLYGGILTNNTSLTGGGAIAMNTGTSFLMAGGEISENTAINGTTLKNGGGLILRNGCTASITGGTIKNNTALNGGGIYLEVANSTISNCTISENTAQTGAAVFVAQGKTATLKNCDIRKNETTGAGGAAVYVKSATVTLDGCTITGNKHTSAANAGASAIYSPSSSTITLKDCTITDNTIAGTATSFRGAVYTAGATEKIILQGDVVIKDNMTAVDGTPVERNIYLQRKPGTPIDVGALTSGAELSIFTHWGTESTPTMVKADKAPSSWVRGWILYDNNEMAVDYTAKDGFFFTLNAEHIHCECGAADCSDHTLTGYKAWNDATALPTAGNFFLNVDVVLAGEITVTGDLNLCLHGHTVTAAKDKRHLSTPANTELTITISDCTAATTDGVYTAGKLTGGVDKGNGQGGGSIYIRTGGTLKLFDGILTNNTSITGGGAIRVNKGATLILANGLLEGNQAANGSTWKPGGAISVVSGGTVQILGGTIRNNRASYGGGVSAEGQLTVRGGTITDNAANTLGGGVYAANGQTVAISGDPTILGNTAKGVASNLHLQGNSTMSVGTLADTAKIGVSAQNAFRAISQKMDTDVSERFFSDNIKFVILYKDSALYLGAAEGHSHCLCADQATTGCDHSKINFAAWDDPTSLPTNGDYYLNTDVTLSAEVTVSDDLNLCLNGHTITAAEDKRHLSTPANTELTLTISDCTAANANGVYTAGKLTGGVDKGNGQGGGSIYIRTGGTLKLFDGILTNNTSITGGGAVRVNKDAYLYMYGGMVSENTAVKDGVKQIGGGICGIAGSYVTILGGTIKENDGSNGGGVFSQGSLTISGGFITQNTANNGGGVYILRNTATLSGGTIGGNTANNGGGLMGKGCTLNLNGTDITGNTAKAGGGAIRMATDVQGEVENLNTVIMTAGKLNNNSANDAGGILLEGNGAKLHMTGGEVNGNKATVTGGGVYITTRSTFLMEGGEVSGNSAKHAAGIRLFRGEGILKGGKVSGNRALKNGGGVFASYETGKLYLQGAQISGNTAEKGAGALIESKASMEMSGGIINNNAATVDGGGGVLISTDCSMTMTGGTISGNTAKFGGGVYGFRATMTFAGGTIRDNVVKKDGGGIRHIGGKLYLKGTDLIGNTAKESTGGGVRAAAAATTKNGVVTRYPAYIYMTGGTISHNEAIHGGGAALDGRGSSWEITGGTFHDNKARDNGGAFYSSSYTSVKVSNVKASNNTAGKNGGGFYHFITTAEFKNCDFSNNSAQSFGGGIYASRHSKVTFQDVNFASNTTTERGGGLYVEFETPATFTNCTFTNNASGYGGGVFSSYSAPTTYNHCTFTDNSATTSGGGLYVFDIASMTDCVLTGNKAAKGGAIFSGNEELMKGSNGWGVSGPDQIGLTLNNCQLTDNAATDNGGALYMALSCDGTLRNSTITGNTAGKNGSAIWCTEDLDMADLIITGNTCQNDGHAVFLAAAAFDGQSYIRGLMKISGDLLITENEGGDLFLDKETTVGISSQGLGKNAKIGITLDSGLLTQRVFGSYHYEGGNCVYTITYGDRSLTEPEFDPNMVVMPPDTPAQQDKTAGTDTLLYVGIGVIAVAILGVAAWLFLKKKKSVETK